ncbi:MAG: DUF3618 domain-containing protein [Acidimicrobiia bacterium]
MATRSDELTYEIQATRGRMDRTLDDIGDRAGPGRLTERLKGAVANTRDTVMGTAGQAGHGVADTASGVADSAGRATHAVTDRSQGNPVAAGLIAFGAGLLAGSVLPESRTENRLAREVQSKAQGPLREQVKESATSVTDRVGGKVQEASEHVKDEARQAKDEVAGDVRQRKDAVQEHAQGAAQDVKDDVRRDAEDATHRAKEEARHHSGQ